MPFRRNQRRRSGRGVAPRVGGGGGGGGGGRRRRGSSFTSTSSSKERHVFRRKRRTEEETSSIERETDRILSRNLPRGAIGFSNDREREDIRKAKEALENFCRGKGGGGGVSTPRNRLNGRWKLIHTTALDVTGLLVFSVPPPPCRFYHRRQSWLETSFKSLRRTRRRL